MSAAAKPIPAAAAHDAHDFSSTRKWIIAFSVMLGTVLEVLDSSIVNVSLPHMQGSFSASVDEIAWVVTSYLVAAGIMIPLTGWIAERFGRKRYFIFSIAMFVISSALCGVAQSLNQIVFFRLMQGAAGAAMMPLSQAILMETFPPREQAMAMAVWGIGMMVAPIMGPTIGGWITDAWSWRWNFYINVPIGSLAMFMVFRFVDDPSYMRERRKGKIDFIGIACLFITLGVGEIVLDRGERADWFHSSWVVYCTAIAIISLVVLIWHELRIEDPVIDLSILEKASFTLPVTLVIFLTFTLYGTAILNPIFLQEVLGYTASKAGLVMAPRGFGTMFAMIILGILARHGLDTRPLVGIGFILVGFAMWEMAGLNLASDSFRIIWPMVIQGVGTGLVFPSLSAAALGSMEKYKMQRAASLYSVTRNLGAAIGTSYLTTLLIHRQQVQQSYLVEHVSVFSLPHMRMPGAAMSLAQQFAMGERHGMAMLYGLVQRQAMMLSFNDIYRMLAVLMALMVPTFLFLKRDIRNLPVDAH
ncbi:MAG TPA: DHA2 family efflux MFS transporter permease subunit [Candidatus Binataceae bacterium]|nr:DHA2 family efflux MFS transporter permease subunit [Candidatus Binataceae bacterium]